MPMLFLDYHRTIPVPTRGGFILLLAGIALVVQFIVYHRGQVGEMDRLRESLGQASQVASTAGASVTVTGDARRLDAEIRQANAVLRHLTLPWEGLFRVVESASQQHSKQIALLSIQPDAEKRQVRISGEAKGLDVLLDYVRRLSKSDSVANVYLLSHQVQSQDRERPVSFSLIAEWNTSQ